MIISELGNQAGFFSTFFFTLNHYIFAKKKNIRFVVKTNNWLYNSWTDYFEPITRTDREWSLEIPQTFGHQKVLENFPLFEYRNAIPEVFVYNPKMKAQIDAIKRDLGVLQPGSYDAIYIRRGDKLIHEATFSATEDYVSVLLAKNPDCKTVFLQTDDYTCYEELIDVLASRKSTIKVITLCDSTMRGMVNFDSCYKDLDWASKEHTYPQNCAYLQKVEKTMRETKSLNRMNDREIYDHQVEMLAGIDILLHSGICVCDYRSNVSRFVKLAHDNSSAVFDVNRPNIEIDYNNCFCPGYIQSMCY